MNKDSILKKIEIAKQMVKNIEEPFRTESFKIIFSKFMESELSILDERLEGKQKHSGVKTMLHTDPMVELYKQSKIPIDSLKNIIDYYEKKFILVKKIEGKTDVEKQIKASQMILAAYKTSLKQDYISSSTLVSILKENGITKHHLNKNLSTRKDIFLMRGKHGKGMQYGINTAAARHGLIMLKSESSS